MGVAVQREITVSYSEIRDKVKRQMAVVGKRISDTQGHTMFAGITLSSAEEKVLQQYIQDAVRVFSGQLAPFVSGRMGDDNNAVFVIEKTRVNDDKVAMFEENFCSYVAAYAAYDILSVNRLDIAKKYAEDMANHVNTAIQMLFTADPPETSGKTLQDMKGEVILD